MGREDEWIYSQFAWTLEKLNKEEEAIENYKKALTYNKYDSWILYHLGICLRKVGSFIEAIKYMKKASEKGELNGWVDLELAWNFAEIGEKEAAKGYLANVEKYLNINDEGVSRDYKIVKAQIESLPTLLA